MTSLPDRRQQIITLHATFIHQAAMLCLDPDQRDTLEQLLGSAEQNGWTALAGAVRRIAAGERSLQRLGNLDEEDRVIAEAILLGVQNPDTLPDPEQKPDPSLAVPGRAGMIQAAARGNTDALAAIANMAEQMRRAGGPMARLASVIRPLINGERDPDRLCRGLDSRSQGLVLAILNEIGKSEIH